MRLTSHVLKPEDCLVFWGRETRVPFDYLLMSIATATSVFRLTPRRRGRGKRDTRRRNSINFESNVGGQKEPRYSGFGSITADPEIAT